MTSRNEMVLDTTAYLADAGTYLRTAQEHGAYLLILMAMHRSSDGWIDGTDVALRAVAMVKPSHWLTVRQSLERFLVRRGDKVSQKRILRDRSLGNGYPPSLGNLDSAYIESNPHTLSLPLKTRNTGESVSRADARSRARQFPEGWKPTLQDEQYAKQRGLDAKETFEAFRDYHVSKLSRFSDWSAAWRTWCRNEVKFNARRTPPTGGPNGKRSLSDAWDNLIQRADQAAADSEGGQDTLRLIPDRSIR